MGCVKMMEDATIMSTAPIGQGGLGQWWVGAPEGGVGLQGCTLETSGHRSRLTGCLGSTT